MSVSRDIAAILQQFKRGSYTNDPNDPNYSNHWRVADSGGQVASGSVPGVVVRQTAAGRIKQQVNIRYSDDEIFLDTPDVSAVGPLARVAQRGITAAGLREPMTAPRPADLTTVDRPFIATTPRGPVEVRPNPSVRVGRPADLSARDQVSNMWHLLRGK